MVSAVVISTVIIVGLVLLGVLLTMVFHAINRREIGRHRVDPLYVPRIQFRPIDDPTKHEPVFAEHELALLQLKVLTKEELDDLILARLDRERRIPCECSSSIIEVVPDSNSQLTCECKQSKNFFTPECSICLNDFGAGDAVRILECGHYFHKECIDSWLTKHSASCPLCKTDMIMALGLPPRAAGEATADTYVAVGTAGQEITHPPPVVVVVRT